MIISNLRRALWFFTFDSKQRYEKVARIYSNLGALRMWRSVLCFLSQNSSYKMFRGCQPEMANWYTIKMLCVKNEFCNNYIKLIWRMYLVVTCDLAVSGHLKIHSVTRHNKNEISVLSKNKTRIFYFFGGFLNEAFLKRPFLLIHFLTLSSTFSMYHGECYYEVSKAGEK